jgi:hypothetical protein
MRSSWIGVVCIVFIICFHCTEGKSLYNMFAEVDEMMALFFSKLPDVSSVCHHCTKQQLLQHCANNLLRHVEPSTDQRMVPTFPDSTIFHVPIQSNGTSCTG